MPAKQGEGSLKESQRPVAEQVLVTWTASERPFKRRNRDFYVTVFAMAAVVGLVLFLVEGWVPVVLLISIGFLFYVMSTVEPGQLEYAITNRGIRVGGKTIEWEEMIRFWFTHRFGHRIMVVETYRVPGRLEVVIDEKKAQEIQRYTSEFIVHEEAAPSMLDRASTWFSKRMPGSESA